MLKKLSIIIFILIVTGLILINSKVFASTSNMDNLIAAKMNITNNHLDTSTINAGATTITFSDLEGNGTLFCIAHGDSLGGHSTITNKGPVITTTNRLVLQGGYEETNATFTPGATYTATGELAYILSHSAENVGGYPSSYQQDLWNFIDQNGGLNASGSGLVDESISYGKYEASLNAMGSTKITADVSNATVAYNEGEDCYLIGPVTINYVKASTQASGRNPVEFGGLVGYTVSGATDVTLIYEDGTITNKPDPNTPFYVKVSRMNWTNPDDIVLTFTYRYMVVQSNGGPVTYTILNGTFTRTHYSPRVEVNERCPGAPLTICKGDGGCGRADCPGTQHTYYAGTCEHRKTLPHIVNYRQWLEPTRTEQVNAQTLIQVGGGTPGDVPKREYVEEKIEITLPKPVINIGGYVWEDIPTGKGQEGDGLQVGENGIQGVKVELYEKSGTKVTEAYTGADGRYEFRDIPAAIYYVQFEYDGQTYEATTFLSGFNLGVDDPNTSTNFAINSKAKEIGREEFDKKFTEITEEMADSNKIQNLSTILSGLGLTEDDITKGTVISDTGEKNEIIYRTENGISKLITTDSQGRVLDLYKMYATTAPDLYVPAFSNYHIENYDKTISGVTYKAIYPHVGYINLGLVKRENVDVALKKDVNEAVITINNKQETYGYSSRDRLDYYDVTLKNLPEYSGIRYNRSIYLSDYNYRIEDYKNNTLNVSGDIIHGTKVEDQELKVFIKYKINLVNQSVEADLTINELVDFYDETLTLISEDRNMQIEDETGTLNNKVVARKSYAILPDGSEIPIDWIEKTDGKTAQGYRTIYTNSLNGIKLATGQQIELYVTFEVNKDNNRAVQLGEKENYIEVNNYSTYMGNYTLGKIDNDSAAGNMVPEEEETYEDDSDVAPIINIELSNDTRTISGVVWEDARTETITQTGQIVGNGVRDPNENTIQGVTVQLIELIKYTDDQGNEQTLEYIWREMDSGHTTYKYVDNGGEVREDGTIDGNSDGIYTFDSYVPGNYIVRFIYGDNTETIRNGYNGHDYKSTAYKAVLDGTGNYDLNNNEPNTSKARDDEQRRLSVIDYSKILTNNKAELLHNLGNYNGTDEDIPQELQEVVSNTWMYAETARILCEVEYATQASGGAEDVIYNVENMNLGIEERPLTNININKEVEAIKVTLANGTVIIDTEQELRTNVNWVENRDDLQGSIEIYMDEEFMQGAQVEIKYKITISNNSEVDTIGANGTSLGETYYTGEYSTNDKIVTTRTDKLLDYYNETMTVIQDQNNKTWIEQQLNELYESDSSLLNTGTYELVKDRNIVTTEKTNNLEPGETQEIILTLQKIISAEDIEEDLNFENAIELIQISNESGRRDYETVPGNQDPDKTVPDEEDADIAELVKILPPTGVSNYMIYYIIGITAGIVLVIGIALIKKKALK